MIIKEPKNWHATLFIMENLSTLSHIRHNYIREVLERQLVELEYLPTELMIADILTKRLPKEKHEFCVNGLGLINFNGARTLKLRERVGNSISRSCLCIDNRIRL